MPKRKLYVGCALQSASKLYVKNVKKTRVLLERHFEVLKFLHPHPGTDQDVYNLDIHNLVAGCDLMVAFLDFPSLGLGYEMSTAIEVRGKPVLGLAFKNKNPSRLIAGITHPDFKLVKYSSFDEVVSLVLAFEKEIFVEKKPRFKLHDSAAAHGFKLPSR
jgi:hypothetical protein